MTSLTALSAGLTCSSMNASVSLVGVASSSTFSGSALATGFVGVLDI